MSRKKTAECRLDGGRDRIRTCEAINLTVFKTVALNHSATLPPVILPQITDYSNPLSHVNLRQLYAIQLLC